MKRAVQNILITVLVCLAVFQTGKLWFGAPWGAVFFAAVSGGTRAVTDDYPEKKMLIMPYRIIMNNDSGYIVSYKPDKIASLRQYADTFIVGVFENGEFIAEHETAAPTSKGFVVYDYSFSLPVSVFAECFIQTSEIADLSVLNSKFRLFNSIAVGVNADADGKIPVIFTDSVRGRAYEYKVSASPAAIAALADYSAANAEASFPSLDIELVARLISVENPFKSADGIITLRSAERAIAPIFGDKPINQASPDDTSFRFANDANIVCRYNLITDSLDYSDYSLKNARLPSELIPSYAAAVRFLNSDTAIGNDLYLTSYTSFGDGYNFTFGCLAAGLPVFLSDALKEQTGFEAYIEITVENFSITKYRRFASIFSADEKTPTAYYTEHSPFERPPGLLFDTQGVIK